MYLIVLALLSSCQFNPGYMSDNIEGKLCAISDNDERKSDGLYELEFKNELMSILCTKTLAPPIYILNWDIKKTYKVLINSEATNTTKRY